MTSLALDSTERRSSTQDRIPEVADLQSSALNSRSDSFIYNALQKSVAKKWKWPAAHLTISNLSTERLMRFLLTAQSTNNIAFLHFLGQRLSPRQIISIIKNENIDLEALGIDLDSKDDDKGWTALHYAVKDNDEEAVRKLLKLGASLNIQGNMLSTNLFEDTPFHMAAREGKVEIVRIFLEHLKNAGGSLEDISNAEGKTPFHTAAECSKETTQVFIDQGVNPDLLDQNGLTSICYAKDEDIAQLLIDSHAQLNIKLTHRDRGNELRRATPLHFELILRNSRTRVAQLLEYRADPNCVFQTSNSPDSIGPLHLLMRKRFLNMAFIELLLLNGADPDLPDESGNTALTTAAQTGKYRILLKLIDFGGNPYIQNTQGRNAPDYLGRARTEKVIRHYMRRLEMNRQILDGLVSSTGLDLPRDLHILLLSFLHMAKGKKKATESAEIEEIDS